MLQTHKKAKNSWYSLAMDESTDLSNRSQHGVFIRGINEDFKINEEFSSVCSMHRTTTE